MTKFVLALGYFDSLHIGHRALLSSALSYAKKAGSTVSVATFDDNFLPAVGRKEKEIFLLKERKALLRGIGVQDVIVFPSDTDFLSQSKEEFCAYVDCFAPAAVFVGEDYRFGRKAEGDVFFLQEKLHCPVFCHKILEKDGCKVSTGDIRKLLSDKKIEKVNELLDGTYFISGTVEEGRKKGREMLFPTVNLKPEERKALPGYGVYACAVKVGGTVYPAACNVGAHPTFRDDVINVEAHLIGFHGDLYGKEICIYFYRFLRDIRIFSDKEALKKQIEKDVFKTEEIIDDKIRSCGEQ